MGRRSYRAAITEVRWSLWHWIYCINDSPNNCTYIAFVICVMGKRSYRAAITEVRSTELRTRQITISPQLLASARWVKQVILLLLISRENSVRTQQVTFAIYAMGKESHNQERSFRLCSGGAAAPPTPYPIKFKPRLDHHYMSCLWQNRSVGQWEDIHQVSYSSTNDKQVLYILILSPNCKYIGFRKFTQYYKQWFKTLVRNF